MRAAAMLQDRFKIKNIFYSIFLLEKSCKDLRQVQDSAHEEKNHHVQNGKQLTKVVTF